MEEREPTPVSEEETVAHPDQPVSSDGSEPEFRTMEVQDQAIEPSDGNNEEIYTTQGTEADTTAAQAASPASSLLLFSAAVFGLIALVLIAVLLTKKLKKS